MKFNLLEIPQQWQEYWTKYPHGYTIIEAITSWVNETNPVIDRMNYWENYLQSYVEEFDTELQGKVEATLSEWQDSGFLEVVINAALTTRMDTLEGEFATQAGELDTLQTDFTTLQTNFGTVETGFTSLNTSFSNLSSDFQGLQSNVVMRGDLIVNVMDFGAAADGVTDDSEPFIAALSAGAATVLIPAGEYRLTQTVTIPGNTKVIGEKGNNITLEMSEIVAQGVNITIDGLQINFDPTNTSEGTSAIRGVNCGNLTIRNCRIYCNQQGNNGLAIESTSDAIIKNNMVYDTGQGHGIAVMSLCDNILIEGNTCRNNGRCGISVYTNIKRVRIIGNSVENFMIRREFTDGGIDTYGPNVYDVVIQGNIVKQETNPGTGNGSGIRVSGVTGATVTGNTVNIAGYVTVGILVQGRDTHDCEAITVANNIIHVTGQAGYIFRGYDVKDVTISGNTARVEGSGQVSSAAVEARSRIGKFALLNNSFSLNDMLKPFYTEDYATAGARATVISGNFVENFTGDSFVGFKARTHIITNNTIYSNHTRICHIAAAQRIIIMGNFFTASLAISNHITGEASIETVKDHNIHEQL